jgi:malate synthase
MAFSASWKFRPRSSTAEIDRDSVALCHFGGFRMNGYVSYGRLRVAEPIARLVSDEIAPGTGIAPEDFWASYAAILADLGPANAALLAKRDRLQGEIDAWYKARADVPFDVVAHRDFLTDIGYLVPDHEPVSITTQNVDPEIAQLAGPQLVVPLLNARFAINAANARWGSLYDALYGTDAIPLQGELAPGTGYNPARGAAVVARAAEFLDVAAPLAGGSHKDVEGYRLGNDGALLVLFGGGTSSGLADPSQFAGHVTEGGRTRFLLRHHGIHVEIVVDPDHPVGRQSAAGVSDVVIEAALTTIQDCEDSVAAVDAADKVTVYRNWLGLLNGTLEETFEKNGKSLTRRLNPDRTYDAPDGSTLTLKGRALLLVRNVGHLMSTNMVIDTEGLEIGEGLVDAAVTVLCALHDTTNSTTGAIYIVKPKMHGPEEVGFACEIFGAVEKMLGLAENTIKIGIMDEERRTSANLKAAIYAARHRVFFINTGFLDRTGDEIHTSMLAGPVLRKDEIKAERWIQAYEDRNVLIGLACGL